MCWRVYCSASQLIECNKGSMEGAIKSVLGGLIRHVTSSPSPDSAPQEGSCRSFDNWWSPSPSPPTPPRAGVLPAGREAMLKPSKSSSD